MYDSLLNIRTQGYDQWQDVHWQKHYHANEATDYEDLDRLFELYQPSSSDHWVDMGAGKGRVMYYVNHRFGIPVTGIEYQAGVFEDLETNRADYLAAFLQAGPVNLERVQAEYYEIQDDQTIFYFFNPFSLAIFQRVLHNIKTSLYLAPRQLDLVFYYPLPDWLALMYGDADFEPLLQVKGHRQGSSIEGFEIFRHVAD